VGFAPHSLESITFDRTRTVPSAASDDHLMARYLIRVHYDLKRLKEYGFRHDISHELCPLRLDEKKGRLGNGLGELGRLRIRVPKVCPVSSFLISTVTFIDVDPLRMWVDRDLHARWVK
jgi:hypothetical protein